jgi:hypothetical protein
MLQANNAIGIPQKNCDISAGLSAETGKSKWPLS